jgi:hypothetical protein
MCSSHLSLSNVTARFAGTAAALVLRGKSLPDQAIGGFPLEGSDGRATCSTIKVGGLGAFEAYYALGSFGARDTFKSL